MHIKKNLTVESPYLVFTIIQTSNCTENSYRSTERQDTQLHMNSVFFGVLPALLNMWCVLKLGNLYNETAAPDPVVYALQR